MKLSRWLLIGGSVGGLAGGYWLLRYWQPRHSTLLLNGAVVVITGASAGIGAAYAEAFAREGAKLVLTARRAERLEALRLALEPYADDVLTVSADVTDDADRRRIVSETLAHFGRIDVLINNAGVGVGGPLETISTDAIQLVIDTNLTSVIALTRLVLPGMLNRHSGLIVNVASDAGRMAAPNYSVYGATKHGIMGFSDSLRRDLDGSGVQVITVLPGWTRTNMVTPAMIEFLQKQGEHIAEPHAIAEGTIRGILIGQTELLFGGWRHRTGLWLERHLPALMSLYWRATNSPEWIAAMRAESDWLDAPDATRQSAASLNSPDLSGYTRTSNQTTLRPPRTL